MPGVSGSARIPGKTASVTARSSTWQPHRIECYDARTLFRSLSVTDLVLESRQPNRRSRRTIRGLSVRQASRRLKARRAFMWFFALGFALVVLNTPFLFGTVPAIGVVLSLLAAPGVLLSLPLHNFVPGGGLGVVGLIAVANGLVYGLVARLIARITG